LQGRHVLLMSGSNVALVIYAPQRYTNGAGNARNQETYSSRNYKEIITHV